MSTICRGPSRALLIAVFATGCVTNTVVVAPSDPAGPPTKRYTGLPVAFEYPGNWIVFSEAPPEAGAEEDQTPTTGPSSRVLVGLDDLNRVVVVGAPGRFVVTPETFQDRIADLQSLVEQGFVATKARVLSGPEVISVGFEPALRWQVAHQSEVGYVVAATVVVVNRGARQYMVTCSHTPDFVAEIERGCSEILASAEFTYQVPL